MVERAVPRTSVLAACLLLCMAGMATVRWHTYDEPLEMDAATYAVIARELREGRQLYTEMWDHKPPAVHLTFAAAQVVAGSGPLHVFLLGLAAAWITLLGVYAAGSAIGGGAVGLLAAVFYAVVSADLGLQANQPNTEAFVNAALVWAFALLVAEPAAHISATRAGTIGALFAAASLYKHVAVVPAVALFIVHFLVRPGSPVERRRAGGQMAVAVAVAAAAWTAVALYFAATHRYEDFHGAVFAFNRQYAGSTLSNLWDGLAFDRLLPPSLYPMSPLIVVTFLGLIAGSLSSPSRAMLIAYAVTTACAVALPGRFYAHYYQLWLPVLSVGASVGVAALRPQQSPPTAWLMRAGTMIAALLLAAQLPSLGEAPEEWSRRKFGDRLVRSAATARAIDRLLLPSETFFEWGHAAELYHYTGRRPPGGEFRCDHLLRGPRERERSTRLLADLKRKRPELVLVSRVHPFPLDHQIPRWFLGNYSEVDSSQSLQMPTRDYRVLVRRGGALEQRLRDRASVATAPQ